MAPFLERVADDVIGEYITPVLDEAHERDVEIYLKAVSGLFQQLQQFSVSLVPTKASKKSFRDEIIRIMGRVFEPHIDLYLQEELDHFRKQSQNEVDEWEKKVINNAFVFPRWINKKKTNNRS